MTDTKDNKKQINPLEQELAEAKDKYIRTLAEYQNYQRRNEEEKKQLLKYGSAKLLQDLLKILDNLNTAFSNTPQNIDKDWMIGIKHIYNDFKKTLEQHGLKEINTTEQPFDHQYHEAIFTEAGPKDIILKELEKGYLLNDKVLRPAKVAVGNGDDPETANRQKDLKEELQQMIDESPDDLEENPRTISGE